MKAGYGVIAVALLATTGRLSAHADVSLDDKAAQVRQIGDFYHSRDGFNGEIVLAHGGHILVDQTYGMANIELGVPLKPGMRFAIGSFTKQFTAAAILWLQDHGKLKVSDAIGTHLGSPVPSAWANITIEQLLVHSSGIPDDVLMDDYPQFRFDPHTPNEVIRAVQDKPLKFAPGSRYDYTNIEYVILGAIVEHAGGMPWEDFVRRRLIEPLGLKNTGVGGAPNLIENRAFGYVPQGGSLRDAVTADPSVLGAAASMYASGADLATWMDALQRGKVLKPETEKAMNTPRIESAGYGAFIETLSGVRVIGHGGDIPGFHTQVYFFPDSDDIAVVLTNVSRAKPKESPGAYAVTNELLELEADIHGIRPSTGREVALDGGASEKLAGTYSTPEAKSLLEVKATDTELTLAISGQPKSLMHLKAESRNKFYAVERSMEVEFDGSHMVVYDYTHEERMVWQRR